MDSPRTLVHARRASTVPAPSRRFQRASDAQADTLTLGRYRLIERLGAGGFGVVWEAHDELLDRAVALKRISLPEQIDYERATREALASARLAHPAIVALYEAHAQEGEFYLVSELVRGQTLAALIDADALSDERILQIGIALADALEHAHERGVIHRDVKPQNVLVPDHPEQPGAPAKLADFGGAQLSGQDALTRTGDVLGTLAYMSPEQCDGLPATESSDLYSLALVLYEALSGINPVRGSTPGETARRIGGRIAPLARHRRDLPPQLTRALDRALTARSEQRGTLDQLSQALQPEPARPPRARPTRPSIGAPHTRAHRDERSSQQEPELYHPRWYQLPRGCWWTGALALIAWQLAAGHSGVALVLLAGALPLALLPARSGPGFLLCALPGALGAIGLAGAFPAISGSLGGWRARLACGALGYWWLALAGALLDRRLWLGPTAAMPARSVWESSLSISAAHVLYPLLSLGVLCGAVLWAVGSLLLPWLVRGRHLIVDLVGVGVWAAALALSEPSWDAGFGFSSSAVTPRGLLASTILLALAAIALRALRGPD